MTQEAVVTRIIDSRNAEVCVTRISACGGNCGGCETCMLSTEVKVVASNLPGAAPGQRVVIESSSSGIMKAWILVYIMPVLLFVAGYLIAYGFNLSEMACIGVSFLSLIVSAVILVLVYREKKHSKDFKYSIIRVSEGI